MAYFHRYLTDELEKWLDRKEILAIKGPRQSGKTTMLNILRDYLVNSRNVKKEDIIYVTFEDRDVLDAFSRNPKEFIYRYTAGNKDKKFYFLIDEFHYLKDGGQKLKLLYDLYENIKFIITGSSSLELVSSTAKHLVGRVFLFNLFQFSFGEFLEARDKSLHNTYIQNSGLLSDFIEKGESFDIKKDIFEKDFIRHFEEYLLYGGYPEVIKTDDIEAKRVILKNIYDTYITKDVLELLRIKEIDTFRTMISLMASMMGGIVNYNRLAMDGKSYFRQTKEYIATLEETFVIRILRPYFSNMATELKKNPKIYFVDTGLRNYIINNFNELRLRSDAGKLVESAVLFGLSKREETIVRYWRTTAKAEVDFILDNKKSIVPIEVKYSTLKSPELSRGFRSFLKEYRPAQAVVLTKGFWGTIKIEGTTVGFIPAWYI